MEELAEGALKGMLRVLGLVVRSLMWLIWGFCFETIAWYLGWPICRLATLGNLPKEDITEREHASSLSNFAVSMVGIVALVAFGTLIAKLVGSG